MPRFFSKQCVTLHAALVIFQLLSVAGAQELKGAPARPPSTGVLWSSANAEHAYGVAQYARRRLQAGPRG